MRGVFDGVGWSEYLQMPEPVFLELPSFTKKFTPVRFFSTVEELDQIRASVMQVVTTQGRLAKWVPEAVQWALWEVMENVLNHAEADGGWVQVSTFAKRDHVNILVVDSGVGIRSSLSGMYSGLTDQEAIKRAVEQGVTGNPERNAGYGLAGCRQIVRSNRGQMIVYSGSSRLSQEVVGRGSDDLLRYTPTLAPHVGTLVELQLRTNRQVELAAALGQRDPVTLLELEQAVGGELVFDVAGDAPDLGTRSSGRQVKNRVMNLAHAIPNGERIVLDFSKVPMASSSFLDEFVGRMSMELGRERMIAEVELRGMNESVAAIVLTTLGTRTGNWAWPRRWGFAGK